MEIRTAKSDADHRSKQELDIVMDSSVSSACVGAAVMTEAKINYLRMMTMLLMDELSSFTENREPRIDLKAEVSRFESALIRSALHATKGQQRRAARLLGTNATTLNTKLKKRKIWIDEPSLDGLALPPASEIGLGEYGQPLTFAEAMVRYEVNLIRNALIQTGGNQSRAARLLGLPITTLNTKIKRLRMDVSQYPLDSSLFASTNNQPSVVEETGSSLP